MTKHQMFLSSITMDVSKNSNSWVGLRNLYLKGCYEKDQYFNFVKFKQFSPCALTRMLNSVIMLIRDEIKAGKSDKEIYQKLEEEFGETVLYAPKFDLQTAGIWLSPVIVGGIAAGIWAYQRHRQRTSVHIMALNLIRGVPLTPREKETMLDILTPPPPPPKKWWWSGK